MGCGIRGGCGDIAGIVVLQPKTLICRIVTDVVVGEDKEFHEEATVLEA